MAAHPRRVGIQMPPQQISWADLSRMWRKADAAGYDSLWTWDHYLSVLPPPSLPVMEGWTVLAGLAALTEHAEVGCLVTGNTYRHPALLASMATTLDHICDGRAILGIGAGWFEYEHTVHGLDFPDIPERLNRLREACEVITRLWTEEAATFDGKYYQLAGAPHEPKPIRKPHPPIMIGGGGEKVLLKIVAQYAQMWNCPGGLAAVLHKRDVLHGHCETIGREPGEIEITAAVLTCCTRDEAKAQAFLTGLAAFAGLSEEEAARELFVGSPEQCVENALAYFDAGISHLILRIGLPVDEETLDLFTAEVLPHLR